MKPFEGNNDYAITWLKSGSYRYASIIRASDARVLWSGHRSPFEGKVRDLQKRFLQETATTTPLTGVQDKDATAAHRAVIQGLVSRLFAMRRGSLYLAESET